MKVSRSPSRLTVAAFAGDTMTCEPDSAEERESKRHSVIVARARGAGELAVAG